PGWLIPALARHEGDFPTFAPNGASPTGRDVRRAARDLERQVRDQIAARDERPRRERFLVGKAIREGVPEPRWQVDGILPRASKCSRHGEPESAKTLLALWMALQAMARDEAVLFIDEDGSPEIVVERLEAMGADPDLLDRLFHYFPGPSFGLAV